MSQKKDIEKRIAKMKKGESFVVTSEAERQKASKAGSLLLRLGFIQFTVVTKEVQPNKFTIAAI